MNTLTISVSSLAISANTFTVLSAEPVKGRTLVTLDLTGIDETQYAVNNLHITWGDTETVYTYAKDVVPNYYNISVFDELLYGKLGGSVTTQYNHIYNSLSSYDITTYLLELFVYYENGYVNEFNIFLPVYPESYYDTLDELDILTTQIIPISSNYTFLNLESKKTGQTIVAVLKDDTPPYRASYMYDGGGTMTYYWRESSLGPAYSRCAGALLKGERTFTNPFNMPATITIAGYVDDDIIINGVIYEEGQWPASGCPLLNFSHTIAVPYTAIVGPNEETVVGYNDNHRATWGINISVTYTTL